MHNGLVKKSYIILFSKSKYTPHKSNSTDKALEVESTNGTH